MSYSGEAADQVVRLSLNGVEVAAKLSGSAAKQLAIMIYAILKDQKKTKGKIRLTNMLRSGKELKVFAVKDGDLQKFCQEAKKYGVLYCVLKDKNSSDGITDIMVRAEDAAKVNRIFTRFGLATVDLASLKTERRIRPAPRSIRRPLPALTSPITMISSGSCLGRTRKTTLWRKTLRSDGPRPNVRPRVHRRADGPQKCLLTAPLSVRR